MEAVSASTLDSGVSARRSPGHAVEAVLAAAAVAVVYLLARTSPFVAAGAFNDDGVYLALGRALAEGEGYRSVYAVGEPVHAKYPPGLPVVYSVLWRLSPDLASVHAAALLLSLLLTSVAAGLVWWVARARLGLGIPVALFFALGPLLLEGSIQYFNLALSEPYYLAAWAGALVLFHVSAAREAGVELGRATGPALALGGVVAAATLLRSQGIVLVPAVLLALLLRRVRRRTAAVFAAGALVPLALWKVWHGRALLRGPVGTQPDEDPYGSWMPASGVPELPRLVWELVAYQVRSYGAFLPPHVSPWRPMGIALWLALFALAAAGALRLWRRHPDLVLGCGAALAVIFFWPWWQDRFVLTVLPFLGLLAGAEVERWRGTSPRRARTALLLLAAVTGLVGFRQLEIRSLAAQGRTDEIFYHPAGFLRDNTRYVLAASTWLLAHTEPGTSVLAPHPSGLWLYSGRQVVNATPALPDLGPSVWDVPGRFLAERLAADRPDLVALANPVYSITRDVAVLQQTCPGALDFVGFSEQYGRVAFYRVAYDDECLEERFITAALGEGGGE